MITTHPCSISLSVCKVIYSVFTYDNDSPRVVITLSVCKLIYSVFTYDNDSPLCCYKLECM